MQTHPHVRCVRIVRDLTISDAVVREDGDDYIVAGPVPAFFEYTVNRVIEEQHAVRYTLASDSAGETGSGSAGRHRARRSARRWPFGRRRAAHSPTRGYVLTTQSPTVLPVTAPMRVVR